MRDFTTHTDISNSRKLRADGTCTKAELLNQDRSESPAAHYGLKMSEFRQSRCSSRSSATRATPFRPRHAAADQRVGGGRLSLTEGNRSYTPRCYHSMKKYWDHWGTSMNAKRSLHFRPNWYIAPSLSRTCRDEVIRENRPHAPPGQF